MFCHFLKFVRHLCLGLNIYFIYPSYETETYLDSNIDETIEYIGRTSIEACNNDLYLIEKESKAEFDVALTRM